MPATPMAVARCVLPVPGPPTSTALCAASVNVISASVWISLRSTGETSKSKPARSRCTGNLAVCIWWLTERMARSVVSACSRCSSSQREAVQRGTAALLDQIGPRAGHAVQAQLP
jgi:hypothetical protein